MRPFESLAAYVMAAIPVAFGLSGCTNDQKIAWNDRIHTWGDQLTAYFIKDVAWEKLDAYAFIDGGAWKNDLDKNYVTYIHDALAAQESGDEYYFQKTKRYIVAGDTLNTSLTVGSSGKIQVKYDLPHKGSAEIMYDSELMDHPYPQEITFVEDRNDLPQINSLEHQSLSVDATEMSYILTFRHSELSRTDVVDDKSVVEAEFHNYIGEDDPYDIMMAFKSKGQPGLNMFSAEGYRILDVSSERADENGYIDSVGTYTDFLAGAQQVLRDPAQTATDSLVNTMLQPYKQLLDHAPKPASDSKSRMDQDVPDRNDDDAMPFDESDATERRSLFHLMALPPHPRRLNL